MKLRYNPKCLVASGLVVGGYWLLAPADRRVSVALALAVATYAGLAHYAIGCTTATSASRASAAPCPL